MAEEKRARNWNLLVYPESAPENWQKKLDELQLEWIESPLHDKDIDENGELKKAHWHVLLLFPGKKSFRQIKEYTDMLNSPKPEICANVKASVRYMAHLDDKEKHQYSKSDIISHGGVDVNTLLKPMAAARYEIIQEIIDYVKAEKITEFIDLMSYAADERFDDWFPALCDNCAYIVNQVIKSNRHKLEKVC